VASVLNRNVLAHFDLDPLGGARAGLHADQATRNVGETAFKLGAGDLLLRRAIPLAAVTEAAVTEGFPWLVAEMSQPPRDTGAKKQEES
jgi:hypothetical protein